jgi:hypothetical protein
MRNAGQARGKLLAGGGVGQVQWQEAHAPSWSVAALSSFKASAL